MEKLASVDSLVITQRDGFELRNSYAVLDGTGNVLYMAREKKGSLLLHFFLRHRRPFEIAVTDQSGETIIEGKSPFRLFGQEITITDKSGAPLGRVVRRFSLRGRVYSVKGPAGQDMYRLLAPILHPWTFKVKQRDEDLGEIVKKWNGFLSETFTYVDTFGVTFPALWDIRTKALLMGAVFLIDFVHFENAKS